ncbi:reverse transcriptase domain-containing protein [Agrobacterium sp.]|uniref:reverse transcriptase domain-containing protein n=1 Tax=Agrobacterium sp. TaxID=361 RepID=UPI004034E845
MSLVSSKELIRTSFNKLKKNKGALTPGTSTETSDAFSEEKIGKISKALKDRTFKWSPIKRIYIPKPGKTKKRPLGIPNFSDKIVQNNISLILTAIYEPEFEYINTNFGFRPNKGCNSPIRIIRTQAHSMDHALEADIEGAYDNVNHKKLIEILRKRIKDEKFLKLIRDGLKCGIISDGLYYDSLLGTPQGGIASPILFNIYMNEFDKFVEFDLKNRDFMNLPKSIANETSSEYTRLLSKERQKKDRLKLFSNMNSVDFLKSTYPRTEDLIKLYKYKILEKKIPPIPLIDKSIEELENNILTTEETVNFALYEKNKPKSIKEYPLEIQTQIRKGNSLQGTKRRIRTRIVSTISTHYLEIANQFLEDTIRNLQYEINEAHTSRLNTIKLDPDRKTPKILYLRYADDWVLFTRGNNELPYKIKEIVEK